MADNDEEQPDQEKEEQPEAALGRAFGDLLFHGGGKPPRGHQ